jgi:hypothetical protein
MGKIYELRRWDGLRWHDIHIKFHKCIQKLIGGLHRLSKCYLISLLSWLQNKGSRLKIGNCNCPSGYQRQDKKNPANASPVRTPDVGLGWWPPTSPCRSYWSHGTSSCGCLFKVWRALRCVASGCWRQACVTYNVNYRKQWLVWTNSSSNTYSLVTSACWLLRKGAPFLFFSRSPNKAPIILHKLNTSLYKSNFHTLVLRRYLSATVPSRQSAASSSYSSVHAFRSSSNPNKCHAHPTLFDLIF